MMSKNLILPAFILTALFVFSGCKIQSKKQVAKEPTNIPKAIKKDSKPYITSIQSNYLLKDSSSIKVYYQIAFDNFDPAWLTDKALFDKQFRTIWTLQPESGVKEKLKTDRLVFEESNTFFEEKALMVSFDIPRLREYEMVTLLIEFVDMSASRKFTNETLIDNSGKRVNNRFGVFKSDQKFPSLGTFHTVNKSLVVRSVNGQKRKLYIKHYSSAAPPALSPMSTSKRNEFAGFSEIKTLEINTEEPFVLSETGTYVLLEDSNIVNRGYGFLVTDERYPRLTELSELKPPLSYMSTNREIDALNENPSAKAALDLHFLSMTSSNATQAKQIIKNYYRRIEKANLLFTNYKEGWKTDKGMVYIVLGPPSRIQKNGQREVWLYAQNQNFQEIIFTFYRKPNQFSEENYELVRYPEYGAYWYPFVEAWRTGSILE